MSKFNKQGAKVARKSGPASPMTTTGTTKTYEGGKAFTRDAKSELFLLAVVNMVGEDTFYESAQDRDDRFVQLIHEVAVQWPLWTYRFLGWLRNKANMRSASVVVAAEAIKARLDAGEHGTFHLMSPNVDPATTPVLGNKDFIPQGMARADEPGEFLAYWTSKYGKNLPMPVRRGLALAANALYDEYSYSKYGKSGEWQMADVVELIHPGPKDDVQSALYRHALNERHNRDEEIPEELTMLHARADFMTIPEKKRRSFLDTTASETLMKEAGLTWEALSGWLGGPLDAAFWERLIFSKQLGYMALLRNLRNFDKAGISRAARKAVQERLADPDQVLKSRQFPFRFLSAYRAVESDHWGEALGDALDASVGNLPVFPGRTLVLVDTSASMRTRISDKSTVSHADIGALFGVVLAKAGQDVDFHGFAGGGYSRTYSYGQRVSFKHELPKGGSVLKGIESFTRRIGEVGHGTQMVEAIKETYDGHDRVILVTDMQAFSAYGQGVTETVPADVRMYGINPSGYSSTALDLSKRNRYEIGGFSDAVFKMIGLLEAGNGDWPF
jgi:hypothetical protein